MYCRSYIRWFDSETVMKSLTFMKSSLVKWPSLKLGQLVLWSLSEPAPSACSELSCFHFWWREPSGETQQTQIISNMQTNTKTVQTASENLHVSSHLIGVRVYHLLADAVQPCSVTNQAQVLLLDDLRGRLARWPPHLLEHLREERNQEDHRWEPECKQALARVCAMSDR